MSNDVKRYGVWEDGKRRQEYVLAADYDTLASELAEWKRMRNEAMAVATANRERITQLEAELHEVRSDRQREHELRVQYAGVTETQAERIRKLESARDLGAIASATMLDESLAHQARIRELEEQCAGAELRIKAIIEWLEKVQPDVFSRGLTQPTRRLRRER